MDLTLTAITAAVVTACFVTTGVKDETPVFTTEVVSEAAMDVYTIDPVSALENLLSEGYAVVAKKEVIVTDAINTANSQAVINIPPMKVLPPALHTLQSVATMDVFKKDVKLTGARNELISFGNASVIMDKYILQAFNGYFKYTNSTYPHEVIGWYNKRIVFGSVININTTSLSNEVQSEGIVDVLYIASIPPRVEILSSSVPNVQPYFKHEILPDIVETVGTTLTARDPSTLSPYRTTEYLSETLLTSAQATIPEPEDTVLTEEINTLTMYDTLSSFGHTDVSAISNYTGLNTLSTLLPNIQLRVKDSVTPGINTLISTSVTNTTVSKPAFATHGTMVSFGTLSIAPYKLLSNQRNELITSFDISTYAKDEDTSTIINNLITQSFVTFSEDNVITNALDTVTTGLTSVIVVKDTELSALNTMTTAGQSDTRFGSTIQISRTETLVTSLGAFSRVNNPGISSVMNTLTTGYVAQVFTKHVNVPNVLNTATTLLGSMQTSVSHPITITLAKQGGIGGTNSIVTIAGFSITPSSVTPPTQAHHTFNGYYTMAAGGTQVINSSGAYVALEDDTYLSPITLYAQWTDVLYTITWKSYTNVTLKTENLVYGSTSTAPTGTADTTQYDYSWPKSSTTVTGTETITETRTTKSYTITWYKYGQSGETYTKRETLLYGATSTAPTGTTDTAQYDYAWPKSSTTVTGAETITETRTTKSYTITWYAYSGSVAKQETLLYGATSTAPAGTTDTMQYQYDWPKASTTVTGTENITETRTLLSYQITWYLYSGAVAKQETLTYGSVSTSPTGTSDTAQYDYSWPKASTTVTGTEAITETRVVKQYTITWKSYTNVTLKSETLSYGSTSTAPIGTSDTTSYDYSWPKASTTVVGAETITETRVGQPYTVTFNGNGGGTPSPTSKVVRYNNTYDTLATVSRTNWEFIGWFTAASGGTKRTSSTTMLTTSNHTLYAHWNPTVASGVLNTMATSALCNVHVEHINILGCVQNVSTSLGAAQYENQTAFNITLNANGGTNGSPTSITGLTGVSINPSSITPATRTNYTITGYWTETSGGTKYINADGTYNNLNSNTFVGNVTLYAQWTINNVYFDWNPTPETVGLRGDIYVGGILQEDNSLDWYQTRPANSVFKVAGLTIPPGWVYSSYTTTHLTGVTVGGSGATTEVQGTGDITQTAARAIAITITGATYTITVVQNGGTGSSASISSYQPKTSATSITMTRGTYTNYRFSHWSVSGANGQATVSGNTITIPTYTTTVQPYGNLTITANWKPATTTALNTLSTSLGGAQYNVAAPFTITLDHQSGSGGTASIICVNGFYLDPTSVSVPSRNGYTFGGYYTAVSGGGTQCINASGAYVGLTNTTFSASTTLYAKWTINTYTLTNDRNGGTGGNNSNTYNITTSSTIATLLGTATRTGYTFSSWKWTSTTAGGWTNGSTYASSTNVSGKYASGTLQAQWSANSYTVTFVYQDGVTTNTTASVTYSSTYGTLPAPTRTGHTFNGWFTASTGGTQVITSTTVTTASAHTLYAQWTANTYTVTFNANGGGTPSPTSKSVVYGSTYGTLATVSRTGYSFNGWFTATSGGTQIISTTAVTITANQTLYAQWTINTYTVTFKDWDNTTLNTQVISYGGSAIAPMNPNRAGYTFSYWSGTYTNVTSDRTITATYTINSYTITWKNYAGSNLRVDTADYGSTVYPPTGTTDTTQYDYYWSAASYTVTGNATITESRSVISYTITWKSYAGVTLKSESVAYGSSSTAPTGTTDTAQYDYSWPYASVVCSGTQTITELRAVRSYTITWKSYAGVTLQSTSVAYGSTSSAPTGTTDTTQYDYSWPYSSVTVTGAQTITETRATRYYTITWKSYAGTTLKSESVAYGSTSSAPTGTTDTTAYDYYWPSSSVTCTGTQTITELRVGQTRTVTFNGNGGGTPSPTSKTVTYGSTYGTLATVSRSGYTFNGWFTATSGGTQIISSTTVSITSNQTLYAQWTASVTAAPSIYNVLLSNKTCYWTIKNQDSSTATVYTEINDSTPDAESVSLAPNATSNRSKTFPIAPANFTVYAYAEASGKTASSTTAYYFAL